MQTYYVLDREERKACIEGIQKALLSIGANIRQDYVINDGPSTFCFIIESENLAVLSFIAAFMYGFRIGKDFGETTGRMER